MEFPLNGALFAGVAGAIVVACNGLLASESVYNLMHVAQPHESAVIASGTSIFVTYCQI
jgi:hypothetical protein